MKKRIQIGSRKKSAKKSSHTIYLVYTLFSSHFFHSTGRRRHVRAYACVCDCAYFIAWWFSIHSTFHLLHEPRFPSRSLYFDSFTQLSDARMRGRAHTECDVIHGNHLDYTTRIYLFELCVCVNVYVSASISGMLNTNLVNVCVCLRSHLCAWVEIQRRLNPYGNAADILQCEIFTNVKCNIVHT